MAAATYEKDDLNLKATELRLGLPGSDNEVEKPASSTSLIAAKVSNKRLSSEMDNGNTDEPVPK